MTKKTPLDAMTVRQMDVFLARRRLARVTLNLTGRAVVATAYPDNSHPAVAERRTAAFGAKESWSMAEASKVNDDAMAELARGRGDTISAALADLLVALEPYA